MTADRIPHGTYTGYQYHRCSCEPCREANRIKQREYVARVRAQGLSDDDPRHGTRYGYNHFGCRCTPCADAGRQASRAYYMAKKQRTA